MEQDFYKGYLRDHHGIDAIIPREKMEQFYMILFIKNYTKELFRRTVKTTISQYDHALHWSMARMKLFLTV